MRVLTVTELDMVCGGLGDEPDAQPEPTPEITVVGKRLSPDTPTYIDPFFGLFIDLPSLPLDGGIDVLVLPTLDIIPPLCENHNNQPNIMDDFITRHEGGVKTDAYPVKDSPDSGVTIGGGVDLHGLGEAGLRTLGVSETLIDKFRPYIPYTGQAAADYLAANPLHISQEDANTINALAHTTFTREVASAYNSASTLNFYALPSGVQTAIVDVAYQYGVPALTRQDFWGYVTRGEWANAIHELNNFRDKYPTRREADAQLVQTAVNAGLQEGLAC